MEISVIHLNFREKSDLVHTCHDCVYDDASRYKKPHDYLQQNLGLLLPKTISDCESVLS